MLLLEKLFTLEGILSSFLAIISLFILYFIRSYGKRLSEMEKANIQKNDMLFSNMLLITREISNINNDMLTKFSRWEERLKDVIHELRQEINAEFKKISKLDDVIIKMKKDNDEDFNKLKCNINDLEKRIDNLHKELQDNKILEKIIIEFKHDLEKTKSEIHEKYLNQMENNQQLSKIVNEMRIRPKRFRP